MSPSEAPDKPYKKVDGELVFEDETKLRAIGNSQGVILPASLVKKVLGAELGLNFDLEVIQKHGLFSILLTPKIGIRIKEETR